MLKNCPSLEFEFWVSQTASFLELISKLISPMQGPYFHHIRWIFELISSTVMSMLMEIHIAPCRSSLAANNRFPLKEKFFLSYL